MPAKKSTKTVKISVASKPGVDAVSRKPAKPKTKAPVKVATKVKKLARPKAVTKPAPVVTASDPNLQAQIEAALKDFEKEQSAAPAAEVKAEVSPAPAAAAVAVSEPTSAWLNRLKQVGLAAVLLFLGLNVAISGWFSGRAYPGTSVGNINLSGLTQPQSQQKLQAAVAGYRLKVVIDGKPSELTPAEIGANYDVATTLSRVFDRSADSPVPLVALLSSRNEGRQAFAYRVDRDLLHTSAVELAGSHAIEPVDAAVVIQNGQPVVQPDKPGSGIDANVLAAQVEQAFSGQRAELDLNQSSLTADVTAQAAQAAADAAKQVIVKPVTLAYQDKKFSPSAAQIGTWLTFTKDGHDLKLALNEAKFDSYVASFENDVYIAPKNHVIHYVNEKQTGEDPGTPGQAVDKTALFQQLSSQLTSAAGALSLAVPTKPVAFKTVVDRQLNLDGKYIEVNLSNQHLYAYNQHQLVYDSPLTSGATGAGFATVEGLFSIYAKEQNRNLNGHAIGYNYNVFVQYWMPFYRDYGLHDASWRNGNFGGPDYYWNGSHGCVNLPLATAAWLYSWADVGTPVWVHS